MGLFGGLISAVVDVVVLPGAIVADVVTLGQLDVTKGVVKKLGNDLEEAGDGLIGNDDLF